MLSVQPRTVVVPSITPPEERQLIYLPSSVTRVARVSRYVSTWTVLPRPVTVRQGCELVLKISPEGCLEEPYTSSG